MDPEKKKQSTRYHGNDKQTQMELGWSCGEKNRQGLQILLMSGVSVTSASQILESFWNIWSRVSHFQTFQHVVLACIHYREGYTK